MSAAGDFVAGRRLDTCAESFPACTGPAQMGSAGCILDADEYIEGDLPSSRTLLVPTEGEAILTLSLFFDTRVIPGSDTRVTFHEPDCLDRDEWVSGGIDVFREAGDDQILEVAGHVGRRGEHPVVLRSDARAHYFLTVSVGAP